MAWVASTVGLQPEIVPSSVSKMNRLGPECPPLETTKSLLPLKTVPVGADVVPGALPAGGGMVTTSGLASGNGWPAPLYSVETPVPLSATQNGLVDDDVIPQALTRFGSVVWARPGTSDTRLV